jgi:ubiquinone/menaquinone biosynthesis C-methylase UbiE
MKTLRDDFDHKICVRSKAKNVADSRVEEFSLSMRRMSASDNQINCKWHIWKLRHLNDRDSCLKDDSRFEKNRVFYFSKSTTLRLVFDETFFDREKNFLKRMTQIDVKTTIRVMTTRNKMKNRNDSNNQQSIEKEEIQQLLPRFFSTTETTIIIRNLRYYNSNFIYWLDV